MIFVTTGTQFPFDRLLSFVDEWAAVNKKIHIVAQTGNTEFRSQNMELHPYLEPKEYKKYLEKAEVIIGHVGTGTMIDAQKYGIPAILMPRKFELNEHRSEHQAATAEQFKEKTGIYIVEDQFELVQLLERIDSLQPPRQEKIRAKEQLINFLRMQVTKK
jgi:UDP-N-acetylglucosamine transferase subunit ALG13